ncbi:helix-turn-helix domain-containing protein [Amycolatopsis sp. NPDC098790]|uniref:AlbA family DNA-binding domain-containing protein n=1 Tax=Amycolatopsis sp. NPDC098790 TaxID=3363939 RepID=UPI00381304A3
MTSLSLLDLSGDDDIMTESMPPVLYLGPRLSRWQPRTLDDVRTVLRDGLLAEGHWLDAKREIGTSKTSKKEFARDLASFANDGGALLIGIAEDKDTGTFSLAPQPLDGLPEMIEQVVGHHCDPPLFVQCHRVIDLDDPAGPNRGVLIVEVPPSPLAPHMVDGKYHGRGDTVKRVLGDAEVERLHAVRRTHQLAAEDLIDAEIARDPFQVRDRDGVRLYVVARPLASPPDLLTEHLVAHELAPLIADAVAQGASHVWRRTRYVEPRARGMGWRSMHLPGRRADRAATEGPFSSAESDLEMCDDGTITFFANGLTNMNTDAVDEPSYFVRVGTILGLVRSVVQLASTVGATFGYAGRWQLAAGVVGMVLLPAAVENRRPEFVDVDELSLYSENEYVVGTLASTSELGTAPAAVTRRLMMRFARGFDVLHYFEDDGHLGRPRERVDG